jgi:hypothetical protein
MPAHTPAPSVPRPEPLCHWRQAGHRRRWATACQHHIRRTGEDNLFAFCPYCGKRLLLDRRDAPGLPGAGARSKPPDRVLG